MADSLELIEPQPLVEKSATSWLVLRAVELLNTPGERGEAGYQYVSELLREREDGGKVLAGLLRSTPTEDVGLRWSALYVLGDIGDAGSAGMLVEAALASLPEDKGDPDCGEGAHPCEGPRDGEVLVRTMAVEALQSVAARHVEVGDSVLRVVKERPAQPVLIEAVKAACALGLGDKVEELLSKKDRWMLDIKIRPVKEVMAEPERADTSELGFMPPRFQAQPSSPAAGCCSPRKEG